MGLFIGQTDGSTTFDLAQAEIDITLISVQDTGVGFDEASPTDLEGVTCVPVTYAQTQSGPTADRLNDLVNNVTYTSPPHIVVFAVDFNFVLSDGTPVGGNGLALPIGNAANPFTSHVCTFYDGTLCDGAGMWVDAEGGGTTTLSTEVMLYHELSHCFHFVTGTTASTSEQEEVNAEIDENDMRNVSGLTHRDVNSHNGGCGGGPPNCCIIASLATGSPYSSEVNHLRRFREHVLRRSRIGDDFFKNLHYHYYAFSPEVCRLMGHNPALNPLIRNYFVLPHLSGLELLVYYAGHRGKDLGNFMRAQAKREGYAEIYERNFLDELASYMGFIQNGDDEAIAGALLYKEQDSPGTVDLMRHINEETVRDDFIKWALVDVLRIWLSGVLLLSTEKNDEEIDAEIYKLIAEWLARLPITSAWEDLSRIEMEIELQDLEQFLFDRQAKEAFAVRIEAKYPRHTSTIRHWVQNSRREVC